MLGKSVAELAEIVKKKETVHAHCFCIGTHLNICMIGLYLSDQSSFEIVHVHAYARTHAHTRIHTHIHAHTHT